MPRTVTRGLTQIVIKDEALTRLQQALGPKYVTVVGILGRKTARAAQGPLAAGGGHKVDRKSKAPMTNAFIGALHEFGSFTLHIPRRSFLFDTLFIEKGRDLLGIRKQLWDWFTRGGQTPAGLLKIYKLLGIQAEAYVQEAFETRGFGKWRPLAAITVALKKSSAILIDTGQLRRAVTSEVRKI